MGGGNKGGGNVGKAGREGCYSPPIDLYRRQVRDNSHVIIYIHIILHSHTYHYVKCQLVKKNELTQHTSLKLICVKTCM